VGKAGSDSEDPSIEGMIRLSDAGGAGNEPFAGLELARRSQDRIAANVKSALRDLPGPICCVYSIGPGGGQGPGGILYTDHLVRYLAADAGKVLRSVYFVSLYTDVADAAENRAVQQRNSYATFERLAARLFEVFIPEEGGPLADHRALLQEAYRESPELMPSWLGSPPLVFVHEISGGQAQTPSPEGRSHERPAQGVPATWLEAVQAELILGFVQNARLVTERAINFPSAFDPWIPVFLVPGASRSLCYAREFRLYSVRELILAADEGFRARSMERREAARRAFLELDLEGLPRRLCHHDGLSMQRRLEENPGAAAQLLAGFEARVREARAPLLEECRERLGRCLARFRRMPAPWAHECARYLKQWIAEVREALGLQIQETGERLEQLQKARSQPAQMQPVPAGMLEYILWLVGRYLHRPQGESALLERLTLDRLAQETARDLVAELEDAVGEEVARLEPQVTRYLQRISNLRASSFLPRPVPNAVPLITPEDFPILFEELLGRARNRIAGDFAQGCQDRPVDDLFEELKEFAARQVESAVEGSLLVTLLKRKSDTEIRRLLEEVASRSAPLVTLNGLAGEGSVLRILRVPRWVKILYAREENFPGWVVVEDESDEISAFQVRSVPCRALDRLFSLKVHYLKSPNPAQAWVAPYQAEMPSVLGIAPEKGAEYYVQGLLVDVLAVEGEEDRVVRWQTCPGRQTGSQRVRELGRLHEGSTFGCRYGIAVQAWHKFHLRSRSVEGLLELKERLDELCRQGILERDKPATLAVEREIRQRLAYLGHTKDASSSSGNGRVDSQKGTRQPSRLLQD
jgi:hypothetical protein